VVDSPSFIVLTWLLVPVERIITVDFKGNTLRPVFFMMLLVIGRGLVGARATLRASPRLRHLVVAQAGGGLVLAALLASGIWPVVSGGYVAWALFDVAFMVAALAALTAEPGLLDRWCWGYEWAAAGWSVFALVQWCASFADHSLAYSFVGSLPRVRGWSFEPSAFALFLLPAAFLLASKRRLWLFGVVMAGLVVTTSRTGFLGLAVGLCFTPLIVSREVRRRVWTATKWTAAVSVVALPATWAVPIGREFLRFMGSAAHVHSGSAEVRLSSWGEGFSLMRRHPVFGWGTGGTGAAEHSLGRGLETAARSVKLSNLVSEVAAELGLVGLVALAAWTVIPLVGLRRYTSVPRNAGIFLGAVSVVASYPFFQTWWRPNLWFTFLLVQAAWVVGGQKADIEPELASP
jgi:hypothetical protein